jgi:DNA-binding transcriptional LysR family regulator
MNLRSVDLNLLIIFDAIVTEQNLSRAAEKIGMTQPAVSAALGRLRITLNDELFVRTGRGVRPTPRAVELQQPIRDILDRVTATLSRSERFDPETSTRVFTLASIDYGGIAVIPQLLQHLQEIHSSVKVNIWPQYETGLKEQMHFGNVDFAIDNVPITDNEFHVETLRKERAFCLVRKGHPTIGNDLSLQQFLEVEHVVLFPHGDRVSQLDEFLIAKGMRRRYGVKVPSFFNMPYIVQRTDMICGLPERMALHFARLYGLRALPAPVPDWVATFYLMWHLGLEEDPGHRWLRGLVVNLCREQHPQGLGVESDLA